MPKWKGIPVWGWLVGWSLLVHLPGLTSPMLDYHAHRQCQTASMARHFERGGMNFFRPEVDTNGTPQRTGSEFPIYSYLLAILFKLFGEKEILGRLLSIAFTAGSVVFYYRFVENRLGERLAVWSSLILCSIPVHIYFTRTVQPEPMALWGFLGFIYYLDRWIRAGTRRDWILTVLLGALGPLLKLPFLYLVGGIGFVFAWEQPGLLRQIRFWLIPVAIVFLTGAWYAYAKTAPNQVLPIEPGYHWHNLSILGRALFWRKLFISRFPELCSTYSGLLLGLIGLRILPRPALRFFGGWWGVTFLYTVLCGEYGMIHQYTSIPWAPANAVFIAAGTLALWDRSTQHPWKRRGVILLVAAIPIHAAFRIAHWYKTERTYLFRAAPAVARLSQPNDLFFTHTSETPVILYYIERNGYAGDIEKDGPRELEAAIAAGTRFALVPKDDRWTQRPDWAAGWSRFGLVVVDDPEFQILKLYPHLG